MFFFPHQGLEKFVRGAGYHISDTVIFWFLIGLRIVQLYLGPAGCCVRQVLSCLCTVGKLDLKLEFSLQRHLHPLLAMLLMDIYGHLPTGTALQK